MLFEGTATAIITPFNSDYSVNYTKLKELIEMQIKNGIRAIVVCGTTGESSTLSLDEKKKIIEFSVNVVKKRIPLIAGTGCNDTFKTIELSKYAETAGADGLLIVTPYYNKCNQEGLFLHYKTIAENVSIPIILYNVPSRTCVNIEPNTVKKLSEIKNIVAIKEANTDFVHIAEILKFCNDDFVLYSGNDNLTLPILSLGGKGVISVISNIMPKEMQFLYNSFWNGNLKKARETQLNLLELMNNLFCDVNPIPIKDAMNTLGYNVGPTRLPLTKLSEEKYIKLNDAIQNANLKII